MPLPTPLAPFGKQHQPVFSALSKGMDLFIRMYDIYGGYHRAPDDRFTATSQTTASTPWVGQESSSVHALLPAVQDSQEDMEGSICLSCAPLRSLSHLRVVEAGPRGIRGEGSSLDDVVTLNLVRERKLL